MESKQYRRSISFEILANNSPGDGDSFVAAVDGNVVGDEKAESHKTRRRRRKSRSRKSSLGDLSPLSPLQEDLSFPATPLSALRPGSRVPPLEGSFGALHASSNLSTPDWRNGDSSAKPTPSASAFSPNDSQASTSWPANSNSETLSRGPFFQGELKVRASSSHGTGLLSEDFQRTTLTWEEHTAAAHIFQSDTDLLRHAAGFCDSRTSFPSEEGLAERVPDFSVATQGLADAVIAPGTLHPPKPPDCCAATQGLAEPVFAPGALHPPTELRQRLVEKTSSDREGEKSTQGVANAKRTHRSRPESNPLTSADEHGTPPAYKIRLGTFPTPQMKDWERLMASNSQLDFPPLELSPMQYFVTELFSGSTLRNTTSVGTEQKRERVYNTMFHVPWRCELLIIVGFIVCLDAFLSLFTVMPARIVMFVWQRLAGLFKGRQLQRPFAAELCDFGCLLVLVVGVAILMQADISIIYHWIRGQGVIKLYVVFNVLEIFDKLCQSFGADVLQVLFNSAVSVECCKCDHLSKELIRFAFDQCIAIVSFFVHSLVIISQAITISAAVNAQNNALLTLLISNNFAEIKSNVFKRMGTDQLHKMAYHDTVERFHIMTHVLFVWAQNVLNGEDSLWLKFFYNAGMVLVCEVLVDVIKHSFLAKFNEVKPAAYSEFLQALCSQTLNSQSHEVHKTLTFVPLAPACVVMRILLPVYASFVPEGPTRWRWPCMLLLGGVTYITLVQFKILVGLGLQYHAKWYLNRHPWTAPHPHFE